MASSSPRFGVKIKNIWNHHLDQAWGGSRLFQEVAMTQQKARWNHWLQIILMIQPQMLGFINSHALLQFHHDVDDAGRCLKDVRSWIGFAKGRAFCKSIGFEAKSKTSLATMPPEKILWYGAVKFWKLTQGSKGIQTRQQSCMPACLFLHHCLRTCNLLFSRTWLEKAWKSISLTSVADSCPYG